MPDLATLPPGTSVFVDTIIFDLHFRNRSATCTAFVERIARGEISAFVNTQVLSDLLHKLMLAEAQLKGLITERSARRLRDRLTADRTVMGNLTEYQEQFENTLAIGIKVLSVTGKLLRESKKERITHGLMVGNSLHLCNMNRCAVPICDIVTHDGDFNHVANIVVWEPMDVV
ncbi:type II toxin-antitoxin system VapC family toxin [Chloroflexota bacterium]